VCAEQQTAQSNAAVVEPPGPPATAESDCAGPSRRFLLTLILRVLRDTQGTLSLKGIQGTHVLQQSPAERKSVPTLGATAKTKRRQMVRPGARRAFISGQGSTGLMTQAGVHRSGWWACLKRAVASDVRDLTAHMALDIGRPKALNIDKPQ
jgi:hypothetical protein